MNIRSRCGKAAGRGELDTERKQEKKIKIKIKESFK